MKINCYLLLYELLKTKWLPKENLSSSITNIQNSNSLIDQTMCNGNFKIHGRNLHYSLKIGDRKRTIKFYRDILGMKILRHDESIYDNSSGELSHEERWSKTMVGYGAEDDYFAFELIYNYPIHNYLKGNDVISVTIKSKEAIKRAKSHHWPILDGNVLEAPGGYRFHILDERQPNKYDPIVKITLACTDYKRTLYYWHTILGLILYERDNKKKSVTVGFKSNEVKIEFQEIDQKIQRGDVAGRICFSCPYYQQPEIEERIRDKHYKILVPLVPLVNPGKCYVRVLILADPDKHEVCFVDDLAFRQLSQYAPEDEIILDKCLEIENEKYNKIGEPAKLAENKQIRDSFRKTQISQQNYLKKNVSILLPVTNVMSRSSYNSNESNSSSKTKETNYTRSTIPQKLTVKVTKTKKISQPLLPSSTKTREPNVQKEEIKLSDTSQPITTSNSNVVQSNSTSTSSNSTTNSRSELNTHENIENFIKTMMLNKLEEEISSKVAGKLDAAINKVIAEKINETVNKVVEEKILESVTKAVAQMEDSMKLTVPRLLPVIQEEAEIVHSFPCLLYHKEPTRIPRKCGKRYRRGRIVGS
ncbi:uncharacterized protein [Onthophagus taurus]|uniref:uncharacterized protein isoform X2 n=1 Tax=Onthophagus taurus TaxID=166361 RepID=UPI000C207AAB|nr:uncharacterized protein LOC111422562 isoform X2 [Onthophagus taurus]